MAISLGILAQHFQVQTHMEVSWVMGYHQLSSTWGCQPDPSEAPGIEMLARHGRVRPVAPKKKTRGNGAVTIYKCYEMVDFRAKHVSKNQEGNAFQVGEASVSPQGLKLQLNWAQTVVTGATKLIAISLDLLDLRPPPQKNTIWFRYWSWNMPNIIQNRYLKILKKPIYFVINKPRNNPP